MRSINAIAQEIKAAWPNINPYAEQYRHALEHCVDGKYICEDENSLILYFLTNASSWRGEEARRLKAELKQRIK